MPRSLFFNKKLDFGGLLGQKIRQCHPPVLRLLHIQCDGWNRRVAAPTVSLSIRKGAVGFREVRIRIRTPACIHVFACACPGLAASVHMSRSELSSIYRLLQLYRRRHHYHAANHLQRVVDKCIMLAVKMNRSLENRTRTTQTHTHN
jgi:hypothetical protein